MEQLNLPNIAFTSKVNKIGKTEIFDVFRKKFVLLTPEEWVRQHVAHFLVNQLQVPINLMALEKKIMMNGLPRRFDIVVYSREAAPTLIIECKAASIPITQAIFDQAARYNTVLKAPFLLITNGLIHHACKIDFEKSNIQYLNALPLYSEMCL